jgi:hypothetical protein
VTATLQQGDRVGSDTEGQLVGDKRGIRLIGGGCFIHARVRGTDRSPPICGQGGREFNLASPMISGKAARRFAPRLVVERWRRDDLFLRLFHNRLGFRLPGTLNPVLPAGLPYPLGNVVP